MKGTTILAVPISMEESMLAGTEVEILQESTLYYECRLKDGKVVAIKKSMIMITDFSKTIDWEQRRYEIAREVLSAFVSSYSSNFKSNPEEPVMCAITFADELIKQLK